MRKKTMRSSDTIVFGSLFGLFLVPRERVMKFIIKQKHHINRRITAAFQN